MNHRKELLGLIRRGDHESVRRLLEKYPGLSSARDDDGVSTLVVALSHGHAEVAYLLLEYGVTPDLHDSAALGRADRIRAMAERSALDLDESSGDGWSAIHLAAMCGQAEALQTLLGLGADPSVRAENSTGTTALHAAVESGSWQCVLALLAAGADPRATSADGATPLQLARWADRTDIVDLLTTHSRTDGDGTRDDIEKTSCMP